MRKVIYLIKQRTNVNFKIHCLTFASILLASCDLQLPSTAQQKSLTRVNNSSTSRFERSIEVDVATANVSKLYAEKQYRGTTQPIRQVSWRSQTEGILLNLSAKVGDLIEKGDLIGRLDDSILQTDIAARKGELIALESELAQATIRVTDAQIKLEEAKIQLEQAKSEAARYQNLAETGLIAQQQAESFRTAAKIAQKALLTAQETIKLEEKAVAIVRGRIVSQKSAIEESKQRQNHSQINAPIKGTVISQAKDSGSLIRVGEEVVTIGDFSQIKIVVPISELELGRINIEQQVKIQLDAFSDRNFMGEVSRIAPTTDPASRQIPVEITVDNPQNEIKGGLLARVDFVTTQESRIVIPEISIAEEDATDYVFIVAKEDKNNQSIVSKRKVIIGERRNGKVEIIAGISPGERYVLRSSNPLKDNDSVSLSIISK